MKQAERTAKLLFSDGLTIATAESCTGGMIASELVNFSGMSAHFAEGYVTYSNEAKVKNLSVKEETLKKYGAVSEDTAAQMALGVQKRANADIGIATTGIAGPDGGTDEKPVGLVYIGCAYAGRVVVRKYRFSGSRYQVRLSAAKRAFELVYDTVVRFGDK
ncbi:MAG: nicotinamide-nucleotide amidohydrolase family protein [Lachnospiraceae bacterium]|nr:nicotinamide-nucleotide amidohydrolase family protein [Lachnospiraceae bacterium]